MGKNKRIIEERARRRPNNSCIPKKVDNPHITINKDDEKVLDYDLSLLSTYREIKAEWQKWHKAKYSGKPNSKNKTPWYTMPGGKRLYNYETRTKQWGMMTAYFRVKSPADIYNQKTIIPKMTRDRYNELLIEAKLKDWEKKHPRPIKKDDAQKDLFEAQFMLPWVDEHTKAREKIVDFVNNIGNRAKIFARYEGDDGYPTKIMELRSDGKKLISDSGNFPNNDSVTVRKVQRAANIISMKNPKLIALKIIDKNQELIVIPKAA